MLKAIGLLLTLAALAGCEDLTDLLGEPDGLAALTVVEPVRAA